MTDIFAASRATAAADIAVTRDGNQQFAVIDLMGRYVEDDSRPLPEVAYAGFKTRAAAEMARKEVIDNLAEGGGRYGPSEVTVEMWERLATDPLDPPSQQSQCHNATPESDNVTPLYRASDLAVRDPEAWA